MSSESPAAARQTPRKGRTTSAILIEFLGSMNLAITLLVALGIGSIIGTVLVQERTWSEHMIDFGPFWFEVFRRLGLYDVYSASWYLAILTFLVISTSVCMYRYTPTVLKEMTRYRDHYQATSLRALSNQREWTMGLVPEQAREATQQTFRNKGFRFRDKSRKNGQVLYAGMKGRSNRLGYIFTHAAIVVICVGGLIDGDLLLKWNEWRGNLQVETRDDIPVSQIDDSRKLPVRPGSFRGTTNIPEGRAANVTFLPLRDGYVVQELPFTILVEDFRIQHYPDGQPRSYESDLRIIDQEYDKEFTQTIRVNEPLTYRGHSIYQASFGDGGSNLDLRIWPLRGGTEGVEQLEAKVFSQAEVNIGGQRYTLSIEDFELANVRPDELMEGGTRHRNVGPTFNYSMRMRDGRVLEFENYMLPIRIDGRDYYLSGVRPSPDQPFRYLHIPAGPDRSLDRFMTFLDNLRQTEPRREAARSAARYVLLELGMVEDQEQARQLSGQMALSAEQMIQQLLQEGFEAVSEGVEARVQAGANDPEQQALLRDFSHMLLERTLTNAYHNAVAEEAGVQSVSDMGGLTEDDRLFYEEALAALSALPGYTSPIFLELTGFEQVQSTGLMIARAPGAGIVYFGSAMLVLGLFLMFYVPHRRLWALVEQDESAGRTRILLAGVGQRDPKAFGKEFERVAQELDLRLRLAESKGGEEVKT
ncbi:cytochrome c biogenesis protein [Alkalispirillum mobile]|uniref:Cytochrome c biogenesis protein n=1 Tax=Alkalispirillum mobile TaxID=85925 RepID=A0A498C004_9GAMM|nr:cytochrome c biogenesis protein ResB [Alkalispirillum mobile]RLK46480.1 cytochrome c biogenesis protein [Alkalispirillum mobile]